MVGDMCAKDAEAAPIYRRNAELYRSHPAGVGIAIYLQVTDVDDYAKRTKAKASSPCSPRARSSTASASCSSTTPMATG
jgi:hypothetical protein